MRKYIISLILLVFVLTSVVYAQGPVSDFKYPWKKNVNVLKNFLNANFKLSNGQSWTLVKEHEGTYTACYKSGSSQICMPKLFFFQKGLLVGYYAKYPPEKLDALKAQALRDYGKRRAYVESLSYMAEYYDKGALQFELEYFKPKAVIQIQVKTK